MDVLSAYVSNVCRVWAGPMEVRSPGLELEMVVNLRVGSGNRAWESMLTTEASLQPQI